MRTKVSGGLHSSPMNETDEHDSTITELPYARVQRRPPRRAVRVLWILVCAAYVMVAIPTPSSSTNVGASTPLAVKHALLKCARIVALAAVILALWLGWRGERGRAVVIAAVLAGALLFLLLPMRL